MFQKQTFRVSGTGLCGPFCHATISIKAVKETHYSDPSKGKSSTGIVPCSSPTRILEVIYNVLAFCIAVSVVFTVTEFWWWCLTACEIEDQHTSMTSMSCSVSWSSVLCRCMQVPFISLLLRLFFWHAPLGVHSAIRRHQPPQRAVLSQVGCFIQCEVVGSQISLDGVQPRDTRTPWWSLPVLWWGAVRIICAIMHTCNVSKRGKTPWLDYRHKVQLLGWPPHFLVTVILVPLVAIIKR